MKPLIVPQITTVTKAPSDQTRYNVVRLLVVGLLFHLIYIGSVFDCYFTSPVVHGMRSYGSGDSVAASKRLVLIVGDGLRADLLFTPNAFPDILGSDSLGVVAPYLRSVVETRGAFGISHTRVPTESRPGHVAIIGGMYEDVSAVTKGWKSNPVDFDSVFNQSSTTFSFGSPDIIPMFARGAIPEKVKTWCYDEDEEDFTKDATALDIWVLDHLKTLLKNATTDPVLDSQLRSEKVIFFLHLLGLDTTGHSYRPHSKEYMENIRVVDNIVREAESLISEFYKDEDTSFVFTADHGMSAIGNHGDGHPDNTRTPLIAWGSGVRGPLPDTHPSSHDAYSEPWKLGYLFRRDVEQADVAALMAALVGIDWPVNSVGVIPDVDPMRPGYLKLKDGNKGKAKVGLINAKVILEQYRIKDEFKRKHTLFYTPFPLLTPSTTHHQDSDALSFPQLASIENLISEKQWFAARQASSTLIQQALQGLHYLQTYDRFLIRGIVSAAYMGWTAYAVLHILRHRDFRFLGGKPASLSTSTTLLVTVASWMVLLAFWTLFALQRSPLSFYVYIMFPCYFWSRVLEEMGTAISDWNYRRAASGMVGSSNGKSYFVTVVIKVVTVVLALQGMVAGYTYRSIWSIGFVLIGVIWPLFWNDQARSENLWTIYARWAISCLVTAVFPLLLVDKKESLLTIMAGGVTILSTGLLGAYHAAGGMIEKPHRRRSFLILTMIQTTFIAIAMIITVSSASKLQAKAGLPLVNQVVGWVVLVVSSLIPFLYPRGWHTVPSKLVMYFLGFGPCFVILSIREEGLFYVAYSITLVHWIQVERIARLGNLRENGDTVNEKTTVNRIGEYSFQWDDVRTALFFLFFVQVGFFGTGNVASISSFYLAPVYRLIPIFNPFYMATLLIFKIVVPYIILAVTFSVLNDTLNLPPFSLLLVALTITDGMTLTFFFKVQDTGSWLEIGQSISFFCITSMLLLWSAGICATGEYLMKDVLPQKVGDVVYVSAEKKKG